MCKQDRDDRLGGRVVGLVEPQFLKAFVLAHQIRGRVGQEPQKPLKIGLTQRIFQIFGNVDLDAALLQNFERFTGLASAGVVVHLKFCHARFLPPRNIPGPGPVAKYGWTGGLCGGIRVQFCTVPAKDLYHNGVRNALIKDGWRITHDPLRLSWGKKDLYVDLGAERLLAAEKAGQRIAVEVKSFVGDSEIDDLEKALGQYILYRTVLAERDPERILYLAVPQHALRDIFEEPLGHLLLQNQLTRVIGFDPQQEVITQWLP